MKEIIEEDEDITVKEELKNEDCNLESKIEIVDDMLAIFNSESADLTEFLKDPNDDPATEDQKMQIMDEMKKKSNNYDFVEKLV